MTTHQSDETAIAQALEEFYFQGSYEGDLNKLNRIFHPSARLFGDVKDSLIVKHWMNGWIW